MHSDSDKPSVSHAERSLFRDAVGPAKRLGQTNRRAHKRGLPSDRPQQSEADASDIMAHLPIDGPESFAGGDALSFRQPGVQLGVMRKLRRGKYRCQDELDLHGMPVPAARHAIAAFLLDACNRKLICVRIIHGKGLRSGNRGPVLKNRVAHWLGQCQQVLAYHSARPADGGTGAVYVLLRRR